MNTTAAVLGPGAVGGSLAVRLSNAGVPVICVAHPEAVGLIALAGLVVESPEGTLSARMEVVEQLAKPVRLLLVTVKAPALEDAVQRVDPDAVANGVVIPLLNGLEHMELLRERFGDRVAAGSISHFQAYRAGRVQIIEATGAPVITIASESLPRAARSKQRPRSCVRRDSTSGSDRARSASSGTSSAGSRRSPRRPRPRARRSASCGATRTGVRGSSRRSPRRARSRARTGSGSAPRPSGRSSTRSQPRRLRRRRATSRPAAAPSSTRSSARCCARRIGSAFPAPALTELAEAAGLR